MRSSRIYIDVINVPYCLHSKQNINSDFSVTGLWIFPLDMKSSMYGVGGGGTAAASRNSSTLTSGFVTDHHDDMAGERRVVDDDDGDEEEEDRVVHPGIQGQIEEEEDEDDIFKVTLYAAGILILVSSIDACAFAVINL